MGHLSQKLANSTEGQMERGGLISYFSVPTSNTMYIPFAQTYEVFTNINVSQALVWKLEAADCDWLLVPSPRLALHQNRLSPPCPLQRCRNTRCLAPGRHDRCHLSFPRGRNLPLVNGGDCTASFASDSLSPNRGEGRGTAVQLSLRARSGVYRR